MQQHRNELGFLEKLPLQLARWSRAVLAAIKKQAIETARAVHELLKAVGRALIKFAKWLRDLFVRTIQWIWVTYHSIETHVLGTGIDVAFVLIAMRFFLLIVLVAVVLLLKKQWLFLFLYIAFLIVAVVRYFRLDTPDPADEKSHKESRAKWVELLRWPIRLLATIASVSAVYLFSNVSWDSPDLAQLLSKLESEAPATVSSSEDAQVTPAATESPPPQQPSYDSVSLINECQKNVSVAVHYSDLKQGWITKGWYTVLGNKTVVLDIQSTGQVIYFYAKSSDGSEWNGDDDKNGGSWKIVNEAFSNKEGEPLHGQGAKNVKFFSVKSGDAYGAVVAQSFTCP